MRNTIKAYLKTVEKARADERVKMDTPERAAEQVDPGPGNTNGHERKDSMSATMVDDHVDSAEGKDTSVNGVQPSIEVSCRSPLLATSVVSLTSHPLGSGS